MFYLYFQPSTIKEAISKWVNMSLFKQNVRLNKTFRLKEEKSGQKSNESKDIRLNGVFPPIEKMDAALSTLVNCE